MVVKVFYLIVISILYQKGYNNTICCVFDAIKKLYIVFLGLSMKKTLSKLLIDRGMTVTELAEKTGISYNTLMNIGKRDLSFSRMVKIADALDVSLDEFRKDNT